MRLIDADLLKLGINKNDEIFCTPVRPLIIDLINNMPTADVEPVRHGRWEVNGDRFYPFCPFCSNCKYKPPKELIRCNALSLEPILTKYCPNCGFENGTKIYKGGDSE